jgi:ribosomal protein S18 acetylase RimI-like enzyme
MNSEHGIRIGTLADLPQIVALMERYWSFEGIAGFDSTRAAALLAQFLSQPHLGTVWTARAAERVVGYLIAVLVFSFEYQGVVAEIDELFVSPQARRAGIGTALLDAAEASLTARDCTCVQLQLSAGNAAAHAFYYRRGYIARANYELFDKRLTAPSIGQSVHVT